MCGECDNVIMSAMTVCGKCDDVIMSAMTVCGECDDFIMSAMTCVVSAAVQHMCHNDGFVSQGCSTVRGMDTVLERILDYAGMMMRGCCMTAARVVWMSVCECRLCLHSVEGATMRLLLRTARAVANHMLHDSAPFSGSPRHHLKEQLWVGNRVWRFDCSQGSYDVSFIETSTK